jgi:ribonucleoside-triphosphate reductase
MKTKCEVWSRSVGYLRPVEQWNDGKVQEFEDRKTYDRQLKTQVYRKETERKDEDGVEAVSA